MTPGNVWEPRNDPLLAPMEAVHHCRVADRTCAHPRCFAEDLRDVIADVLDEEDAVWEKAADQQASAAVAAAIGNLRVRFGIRP